MARLPYLSPEDLPDAQRSLLDRPVNYYRALAHHPDALGAFSQLAAWLRWRSLLDHRLRELVTLQVALTTGCRYEVAHHVQLAEDFGVDPGEIRAVLHGDAVAWDTVTGAALRIARDITRDTTMVDADWQLVIGRLGIKRALEVLLTTTYYNHVMRAVQVLEIDLETEFEQALRRYDEP